MENQNNDTHFQFRLSKAAVYQLGSQLLVFSLSLSFAFFASLHLAVSVRLMPWGERKGERDFEISGRKQEQSKVIFKSFRSR